MSDGKSKQGNLWQQPETSLPAAKPNATYPSSKETAWQGNCQTDYFSQMP